jgi:predicted dehydrogenase
MNRIRWGILGTGHIAHTFARDLALVDNAVLQAVGSRNADRAQAFADAFDIPRHHGSYEALAADDDVDVIYVATPHPAHMENMITCLDGGKAVLCEKPFTMNAREAQTVFEHARRHGLFVMEGMWTRCFPVIQEVTRRVHNGDLGALRHIDAGFCEKRSFDAEHRLYRKTLGGGALLDLGVYPLSFAQLLMGSEPDVSAARAIIGNTGVDEHTVMLLAGGNQATAALSCSFQVTIPRSAVVAGTAATLEIPAPWTRPERAVLSAEGRTLEEIVQPIEGHGFVYEAREVMRCLNEGATESPLISHEDTLSVMRVMDAVRDHIGLRYPADD